jgi:hypothetical protein
MLDDVAQRQVPYAISRTLNAVALEAQEAVRQRIHRRGFAIRSAATATWLERSIKFAREDRATKTQLSATIRVEPPGGNKGRRGSLLAFLERGGVRTSKFALGSGRVFGAGSVVVPKRASKSEQIPRSLYPKALRLQESRYVVGSNDGGGLTPGRLRGKQRSFAVRTGPQRGLILQRTGPGPSDTRVLFWVRSSIKVPGRGYFRSTIERVASERFAPIFAREFAEAMRTAR